MFLLPLLPGRGLGGGSGAAVCVRWSCGSYCQPSPEPEPSPSGEREPEGVKTTALTLPLGLFHRGAQRHGEPPEREVGDNALDDVEAAQIEAAVAALDGIVKDVMERSDIPGVAVAVVSLSGIVPLQQRTSAALQLHHGAAARAPRRDVPAN